MKHFVPNPSVFFVSIAALAFGAGACSGDKGGSIAGVSKKKTEEKKADESDDSTLPDLNDTSPGDESQSIEAILKQCGVDQATLNDPDAVLLDKTLHGWPKVFIGQASVPILGVINYRVQVKVRQTVHATMKEVKQTTDFDVTAEPSQAKSAAEQRTQPNKGSMTAQVLPASKRPDLMSSSPDWNGILCTVQPVTEINLIKGGKGKLIKFNPPLPMSVSPKADPARYKAEIGEGRTFSNIEAEIEVSADPAYPVGSKFKGTVTIAPTDPKLTININENGGSQVIQSDMAYSLHFDFGGVDTTLALGLNPVQTMFIDNKARDINVIVVDTGTPETGVVVLSEKL